MEPGERRRGFSRNRWAHPVKLNTFALVGIDALHRREENIMMLQGTVMNGVVVLDQPTNLPDGTRVDVVAPPVYRPAHAR